MAQARVRSSRQNLHVREAQKIKPCGLRHFGLWIAVTLILKASNTSMCGCLLPGWRLIDFILPQALIEVIRFSPSYSAAVTIFGRRLRLAVTKTPGSAIPDPE